MTLFPNRFQFTSPGEGRNTSCDAIHGMFVGCLAIGTRAFHARLRFYLSNCSFFFFLLLLPLMLSMLRLCIHRACSSSFFCFYHVNFELPFFALVLLRGNDTSADFATAAAATLFDTGYRVGKVHKHISSCTFSTIKWKVHYDVPCRAFLWCFSWFLPPHTE